MASSSRVRELQVVLDVDGVTRRGVTDAADPGVVQRVKRVLAASKEAGVDVSVAFLSGTPAAGDPAALPEWCTGNRPLSGVFLDHFDDEVEAGVVSVFGQLGADRLVHPSRTKDLPASAVVVPGDASSQLQGCVLQAFTHREQVDTIMTLLENYHEDLEAADAALAARARALAVRCADDVRRNFDGASDAADALSTRMPHEFEPYAALIRSFDPKFRLISNGALIEYHDFATRKHACHRRLAAARPECFCSSGRAHRGGDEFLFFMVSLTNKARGVGLILDEQRQGRGDVPILTVGDTALDYSMHARATVAFHVGLPSVWEVHNAPHERHVVRVAKAGDPAGAPLVDGTHIVLDALERAVREADAAGMDLNRVRTAMGDLAVARF